MTFLVRIVPLLIVIVDANATKSVVLKNNLNPVMIPYLESAGGNCQDAVIAVELWTVKVKLRGACEGTAIAKM